MNSQRELLDHQVKVGVVLGSIKGLDTEFKMLSSKRRMEWSGDLLDISTTGVKKKYKVFLFNDLLIWTRTKNKIYHFRKMFYLSSVDFSLGSYEGRMAICLVAPDHSLNLVAKTNEQTKEIFEIIKKCKEAILKQQLKDRRKTFVDQEGIKGMEQEREISYNPGTLRRSLSNLRGLVVDPKYKHEFYRVKSFTANFTFTWPHEHPTPQRLAAAGLFFSPSKKYPDQCKCYSCGVKIRHWLPEEDPKVEHKRKTKYCREVLTWRNSAVEFVKMPLKASPWRSTIDTIDRPTLRRAESAMYISANKIVEKPNVITKKLTESPSVSPTLSRRNSTPLKSDRMYRTVSQPGTTNAT